MTPAKFLESAAVAPESLLSLVVNCFKAILASEIPVPLKTHFPVNVARHDGKNCGAVTLTVDTRFPELISEIVSAAAAGAVRAEQREVFTSDVFMQTRIVLFIGKRVVAQLFATTDDRYLQLDVAEPPEVWDIGKRALTLVDPKSLPFSIVMV